MSRGYKKAEYAIDFGPVEVAPGATVYVRKQPEHLFRVDRMFRVGSGEDLHIVAVLVGSKSQMPASDVDPVMWPVSMFPTVDFQFSPAGSVLFDTCDPALFISLAVYNKGSVTRTWQMQLAGRAVVHES